MKRFALLAVMMFVVCLSGCDMTKGPNASNTQGRQQSSSPFTKTLDLGTVTILYQSYQPVSEKVERVQKDLLNRVSESILHDRSVSMQLVLSCKPDLVPWIAQSVAAGTAPEICTAVHKKIGTLSEEEKQVYSSVPPLSLNKALEEYGYTIKKTIPDEIWQAVSINGQIMQIPQLTKFLSVPVLNQYVMDQYGWSMPKNAAEFEALLQSAKEAAVAPIVTFSAFESSINWWVSDTTSDIVKKGASYDFLYATDEYRQWMKQQRKWIVNEWIVRDDTLFDMPPLSGKWLCCEMTLSQLADTSGVNVLPNFSIGGATHRSLTIKNPFESYTRPEALVIFFDWMLSSAANNKLLVLGEEGKDYRMVNDEEYNLLQDTPWPEPKEFLLNPIVTQIHEPYANLPAYQQAIKEYGSSDNLPAATKDRLNFPYSAILYHLAGTRFSNAYDNEFKAHRIAYEARDRYLNGEIELEEYEKIVADSATLLKEYIELLKDWNSGAYDIWQDVYRP